MILFRVRDLDFIQLLLALLSAGNCYIPCPVCTYNLRANISPRCPECGAEIQLRIGSPDLKMAGWITALLCLSLPLVFTATLSIILLMLAIFGGWNITSLSEVAPFVMTILFGGGVYTLIRARRRFWRASFAVQTTSVVLCAVTGLGGVAVFIWLGL